MRFGAVVCVEASSVSGHRGPSEPGADPRDTISAHRTSSLVIGYRSRERPELAELSPHREQEAATIRVRSFM
jgi:hypothetical protein